MYSLTVRDRVMIAHSFNGAIFGPAQGLHGATYVVEWTVRRPVLDADGLVVDIGLGHTQLAEILSQLAYQNLDEMDMFKGQNTTTEFLAHWIWTQLQVAWGAGKLGEQARGLTSMAVVLRESDVAWAGYDAALQP